MDKHTAQKLTYMRAHVNRANLQLLVDELRKGTRRQARSTLARRVGKTKRYCCLGLACEVAKANGLNVTSKYSEYLDNYEYADASGDASRGILPIEVAKFFGFASQNPKLLDEKGEMTNAATLNDDPGYRYNFKQLADAFERTYLATESAEESSESK